MKKGFAIFIVCVILTVCIGTMCACNKEPRELGNLYTFQEAYEQGILTKDDLQMLATTYFRLDGRNESPREIDFNKKTESAIKETIAHAFRLGTDDRLSLPNVTVDRIKLSYFGEFNGAYLVASEWPDQHIDDLWGRIIDIDGIQLKIFCDHVYWLWKAF